MIKLAFNFTRDHNEKERGNKYQFLRKNSTCQMMRPQEPENYDQSKKSKKEAQNSLNYVEANIFKYIQEMSFRDVHFLKLEFQLNCFYDFHEIQRMLYKYEFK